MYFWNYSTFLIVFVLFYHQTCYAEFLGLYPYETETRELKSLDGIWNFKISPKDQPKEGFDKNWHESLFDEDDDCMEMPVPSSFNDITTNKTIRDFLGVVWYQRTFFIPKSWFGKKKIIIHFGSVHYLTNVWINKEYIGYHLGGHIPFEFNIEKNVREGINIITVAVNNTLTESSIPQGFTSYPNNTVRYPPGYKLYSHNFDYFDYAGINRPIKLYTTPLCFIADIKILSSLKGSTGYLDFKVVFEPSSANTECIVSLKDKKGLTITTTNSCSATLKIDNVKLWWPINTGYESVGYLYTLEVFMNCDQDYDIYRLPVGIRTIKWNSHNLFINDKPIYLKGFGMHEDADIRGRGFDYSILVRDFNLIKWVGANAIRTSHYPYSEEFLNEADKQGLLVILETPACSLNAFTENLLINHAEILKKMVKYNKNRPSVIIWSLANEPYTNLDSSASYFSYLVNITKTLDKTRPVTFVTSQSFENDKAVKYMDIICVNRYSAWYQDPGHIDLIQHQVINELTSWHENFMKPVIMSEYGAGSVTGLHVIPSSMWSEEYQVEIIDQHKKAYNILRGQGFIIGEMIWNFIDFNTPQEYIRPGQCAKGLFTRNRQPKEAAFKIKKLYQIN
uniref:Beta-glucuronidase n=1 Tax=Clastoptera arizonana TaxID=38151 RepID=A0A1B6D188_9HEMI